MILLAQIYASQEYTRERTYIHTIVNYFLEGNMQTWVLLEIIMQKYPSYIAVIKFQTTHTSNLKTLTEK